MERSFNPAVLLVLLYVVLAVFVIATVPQLPLLVATHFNASGHADGWMPRASIAGFTLVFGFVMPAFMLTVFWVIRFLPFSSINLPNKDYWLAPERREETFARMLRHGVRLGCLSLALVTGLHYLILVANSQTPPEVSTRMIAGLTIAFAAGLVVWIVTLFRVLRLHS